MSDMRLKGRHLIITGGARGIGRGIAERAAEAGADITVFDVDAEKASETAAAVEATGATASAIEVDVSDADAVRAGVATAVDRTGPVDGLVNNAGVQEIAPVLETSTEQWDAMMAVNARGTFLCSKVVADHMIEAGVRGDIVNVASVAVERPDAGQSAYAASKGAVSAFTKVLAKELGEHGIAVNSVNPGAIDTPMFRNCLGETIDDDELTVDELREQIGADGPLSRLGRPDDVGNLVVFLLSTASEWITGESFTVRGNYE